MLMVSLRTHAAGGSCMHDLLSHRPCWVDMQVCLVSDSSIAAMSELLLMLQSVGPSPCNPGTGKLNSLHSIPDSSDKLHPEGAF